MRSICCLMDLQGAPTSAVILRRMLGAQPVPGQPTGQVFLTGPAGFAFQGISTSTPTLHVSGRQDLVVLADSRLDNGHELSARLAEHLPGRPSATDAELIAAAYRAWGSRAPAELLGDFAFVLWDADSRRLLAARDPMGIRRLHLSVAGSRLCLATDPHQILRHPAVAPDLDEATLGDYLCGLLDPNERTMFRKVRALQPGHCLVAENGKVTRTRFWDADPEHRIRYRDRRQYAEHLRETLALAVECRLATAPGSTTGITLSGGLDSTSVAALAQRQLENDPLDRRLSTASFVFDDLPECDERVYIDEMDRTLGTPSLRIRADDFGLLADTPNHPDPSSPFLAWESASRALFRLLRDQGATRLLTGLGGDELLAGSRAAYFDRLSSGDLTSVGEVLRFARRTNISTLGALYRCFVAPGLGSQIDRRLREALGKSAGSIVPDWIHPEFRARSGLDQRLAEPPPPLRFRGRAHRDLYHSIVVRGDHLRPVTWFDRRAIAQGLEALHPFLDRRILELVFAFPPGELFRTEATKPLLRSAMTGILPEKVRCRPDKTTLVAYVDERLQKRESLIVEEMLTKPLLGELGLIEPKSLRQTYRQYRKDLPKSSLRTVWNAIHLESWLREHAADLRVSDSPPKPETLVA